jgi:hypothetical protein
VSSSEKFCDHVLLLFNEKLLEGGFCVTTRKMMGEYILYVDGKVFGEASGCDAPGTARRESEEEINDGLRSAILYTLLVMPVGISFSDAKLSVFFDEIHKQADGMRSVSFGKRYRWYI